MGDAPDAQAGRRQAWLGALLGGALVATLVGGLVLRSLFVAIPQSYDALLYGRSLWGIATGHGFNPVYGTHWLGIHANLALWPLAPLARLFEPTAVLAVMSALSLGATAALAGREAGRMARDGALLRSLGVALLVGLATPLVTNPFLFDARPEALAVPLLTAALLRARRLGAFDARALLLATAAAATREEFAALTALALLAAPVPWTRRDVRRRALLAFGLLAAAVCYLGWVRPGLDGGFSGARAVSAAGDLVGVGDAAAWTYRATLLASLALSAGGLALVGFRWLGTALAGVVFCLAISKHGELAIRFHYAMFLAPGLVVAIVDGLARTRLGTGRALTIAGFAGLLLTWHHGSLPLSRTYDDAFFGLLPSGRLERLAEVRLIVDAIPPGDGVALPYIVASSQADRTTILSMETLAREVRATRSLPAGVDHVGLLPADFEGLGQGLVYQAGARLAAWVPGYFALLTTRPVDVAAALPGIECPTTVATPRLRWPVAGLELAEYDGGAWLQRTGPPPDAPPALLARLEQGRPVPRSPFAGLLRLTELPVGCRVRVEGDAGDPWVLLRADGTTLQPEPREVSPPNTQGGPP
jgi:hypothetical protein